MSRLILLAPLILFGLGGVYLMLMFMQPGNEGRVFDNLVPELIGFCLEGLCHHYTGRHWARCR